MELFVSATSRNQVNTVLQFLKYHVDLKMLTIRYTYKNLAFLTFYFNVALIARHRCFGSSSDACTHAHNDRLCIIKIMAANFHIPLPSYTGSNYLALLFAALHSRDDIFCFVVYYYYGGSSQTP